MNMIMSIAFVVVTAAFCTAGSVINLERMELYEALTVTEEPLPQDTAA